MLAKNADVIAQHPNRDAALVLAAAKPNFDEMLRHLQLLFGGCTEGMVEIAWGQPAPNKAMLTDMHSWSSLPVRRC